MTTELTAPDELGELEKVHLLLDHGAEVNARSNWGRTALFEAATWHKPQVVRLLLDRGAEVNVRTKDGTTPLMHAAWPWPYDTEAVETLDLLLSHGADVNAADQQGKTALIHLLQDDQHDGKRDTVATFLRREVAYEEIVSLLIAYQAKTEIIEADGNTAHHYCVLRGLTEVASLLDRQVQRG